ncbi:MAG: hypothetical protein ABEI13_04205 [Candidatus Paceibacteria bacterium]
MKINENDRRRTPPPKTDNKISETCKDLTSEQKLRQPTKEEFKRFADNQDLVMIDCYPEAKIHLSSNFRGADNAGKDKVDLLYHTRKDGVDIYHVIEIKIICDKQAIGQTMMYKWQLNNASHISFGGSTDKINLSGDYKTHAIVSCCDYNKPYFDQFIKDMNEEIFIHEEYIDFFKVTPPQGSSNPFVNK